MGKPKRGDSLVCVPCGGEDTGNSEGVSTTAIWCCSAPVKAKKAKLAGRNTKRSAGARGSRRKKSSSRK